MNRISPFAPHLGAALGAGLMLAASLAFNAGAGGAASAPRDQASGQGARFAITAQGAPRILERGQTQAAAQTQADMPAPGPARSAAQPAMPADRAIAPAPSGPRLAILLDDVADLAAARRALALEVPVTLSVLPFSRDAGEIAALAAARGRDFFVHLPMEPVGLDDPGPHALTKALAAPALAARINLAFAQAPGAAGFNNHMGSRMTADRAAMDRVFAALGTHRRGLLFVDSMTHPESQAAQAAQGAGLTALKRDVFLDHDRDPALISARLDEALAVAQARGSAILIAHPRPESFAALESLADRAASAGVTVVPVTALAAAPG